MQKFLVYQPVRVTVQLNYWRPRAPLVEVIMIAVASHTIGQLRNDAWRQCRQKVAARKVKRDNPHLLPEEQQRLVTEAVDQAAAEYSDAWWTSCASEFMCYLTHAADAGGTPVNDRPDWERTLSSYLPEVSDKERHIVLYLADMTAILLDPAEVAEVDLDSEMSEEVSSAPMLLEPPSTAEPPPEEILLAPLLQQPSIVEAHPEEVVSAPALVEPPSTVEPAEKILSAPLLGPPEISAELPEKVVGSDNIIAELPEKVLSAPLLERPDNVSTEQPDNVEPPEEMATLPEQPEEIITAEKEIAEPPKQRKKAGAPPKHLMSTLPRLPQPKRAAKKREPVRASPYPSRQKAIANKKRK